MQQCSSLLTFQWEYLRDNFQGQPISDMNLSKFLYSLRPVPMESRLALAVHIKLFPPRRV